MEYHPNSQNPRTPTTLSRVEPANSPAHQARRCNAGRRTPRFIIARSAVGRCSSDLTDTAVVGEVTRQVLDISQPRLIVTDHVAEQRKCRCGHVTTGVFPPQATATVCWGPRVKAVAVYLMIRQHIPLERAHEAMDVLFGAPVSEGSWRSGRSMPHVASHRSPTSCLSCSNRLRWVCADETPIRVATGTGYVHTISTETLTLLAHHTTRGLQAILGHFRNPDNAYAFCTIRSYIQTGRKQA
jgi:transposase